MQFRDDRRGQAIQIGAVLLLGALVLAFSIYQATVVPAQNSKVEFQHSQHVERQLQDVRNAIVTTGQTGDARSLSVQLGTDYPPRLIALNPPPATGSLATVGTTNASVNATIAHARASGETGDFWNGTNRTYNTGALAYRPGYNEYGGAPVTWYENSVLFDQFRTANLTSTGQRLIDGDRISLVTLNGSYYASQEGSVSLDLRGVSTSSTTVSVTNATASSNVTITVPTRLTGSDWRSLLSEQLTTGHVANVTTTPVPGAGYRLLHVVLDRGVTYQLHIARVGFGSKVVRPGPAYLTTVGGNGTTVPEGAKTQLTVEVRDALDNPKQDVRVVAGSQWSNATVTPNTAESDGDGRVTLTYTAPNISGASQRVDHVQVSLNTSLSSAVNGSNFNGSTAENVSLAVRVDNSDGSGLGGGSSSNLGVGQGGASTYSTANNSALLVAQNGLWKRINKTDQILFNSGQPVVDPTTSDQHVLTEFTITNASETFSVEMQAYRTTGGTYAGSVRLYRFATDNQVSLSLTADAARRVLSADRYNGTDILNRANYDSSDSTFVRYQRTIARMDSTPTHLVVSNQDGRVNLTFQGEALFSAVEPNPSTANDADEFVRVSFENATSTGGWTIQDADSTISLPDARLDGSYYFSKNKSAFVAAHPSVSASRVYEAALGLTDAGDALVLRDAQGNRRDEVAYGTAQTSHGWSLSVSQDEVANRTAYADGTPVDTDGASDWTIESESNFFGTTAASRIAYDGDGTAAGPGGRQSGVRFSATNTGSASVTVTDISISSSSPANKVFEGSSGTGQWNHEVFVAASTNGYLESGDQNYNQGGYTLGSGSTLFDAAPIVGSGTTATFSIYEFRNGNGNGAYVNMNGQPVTVTLTFADGSTQSISFTG